MHVHNGIYLCTFDCKRVGRAEITASLIFDDRVGKLKVCIRQEYEAQDEAEVTFVEPDVYFSAHPEYRDGAIKAIAAYLADNSAHAKALIAAASF